MKIQDIERIEKKIQYLPDKELYDYALMRRYALLQAATSIFVSLMEEQAELPEHKRHTFDAAEYAVDAAIELLVEIERRDHET